MNFCLYSRCLNLGAAAARSSVASLAETVLVDRLNFP